MKVVFWPVGASWIAGDSWMAGASELVRIPW